MTHTITVENIKCGGCMNSIKTALLKMEGVATVSVDKDTEAVTAEATVDRNLLVEKLAQLGYPEKGNNNVLYKAKSYVSCAIGRMGNNEK